MATKDVFSVADTTLLAQADAVVVQLAAAAAFGAAPGGKTAEQMSALLEPATAALRTNVATREERRLRLVRLRHRRRDAQAGVQRWRTDTIRALGLVPGLAPALGAHVVAAGALLSADRARRVGAALAWWDASRVQLGYAADALRPHAAAAAAVDALDAAPARLEALRVADAAVQAEEAARAADTEAGRALRARLVEVFRLTRRWWNVAASTTPGFPTLDLTYAEASAGRPRTRRTGEQPVGLEGLAPPADLSDPVGMGCDPRAPTPGAGMVARVVVVGELGVASRSLTTPGDALTTPGDALTTPGDALTTPGGALTTTGGALTTPGGALMTPGGALMTTGGPLMTPAGSLTTPARVLDGEDGS
jgi:hypothetical protein